MNCLSLGQLIPQASVFDFKVSWVIKKEKIDLFVGEGAWLFFNGVHSSTSLEKISKVETKISSNLDAGFPSLFYNMAPFHFIKDLQDMNHQNSFINGD